MLRLPEWVRGRLWAVKRWAWMRRENMPTELRSATLVLNEERLTCDAPVPMVGQPDQVYALLDGDLVIVDTKVRKWARAYKKDIAQLSVNRMLLLHSDHPAIAGRQVKPYGYIRVESSLRGVTYIRVDLRSQSEVFHWWLGQRIALAA